MATPAAPQVVRLAGRGRQPRRVEQARDYEAELETHRLEALAFVDACWPLLSRLETVAQHIGPVALQTVYMLEAKLAGYEHRHLPADPEPPAVAA